MTKAWLNGLSSKERNDLAFNMFNGHMRMFIMLFGDALLGYGMLD